MASQREREKKARRTVSSRQWAGEQSQGFESKCVKLPDGIEGYKQEDGVNLVDTIPYLVKKGKGTPGGNPRAEAGFLTDEREYQTHRVPGTGKFDDAYCCRRVCFGKKCAGCEWLIAHGRTADEDLVVKIMGQLRHLFIVNDKPGKLKNKLKIFDAVHKNRKLGFGQQMAVAINAQLDEDECHYDLKEGKQIRWECSGEFKQCLRIDFKDRDYEYPDSILDHGIDLDECLIDPGYDALKEALETGLTGGGKPEDNGERAPAKGKAQAAPDEDEDDDDDKDEDEAPPKKPKKSAAELEDEDDEDDEDEAPPKKKGKKPAAAEDEDEEDDDDDEDDDIPFDEEDDEAGDDDEEEDEPAPPKKKKAKR